MAGVKISKLKKFEEILHDENLLDYLDDMIVPVSLGNKTISIKLNELLKLITDNLMGEVNDVINENERVTALSLMDLNNIIEEVINNVEEFKEESAATHAEMIENQAERDDTQDERINAIDDAINLWEIYGS